MENSRWQCPKCGRYEFETDTLTGTGGFFSRMFDIQNKRFTTVTCVQCRYTELYKVQSGMLGQVFDFFTG